MFIKSALVSLVLAASALATPLRRADTIKVAVTPSAPTTSLDALKFTATVTNTGSETVKILKYGTILDEKLPTKSFEVTKDGASVPFTGIRLSVSLTDADDSAYTIIPAGESITVSHDISSLYDFSSLGEGKFTFAPKTDFLIKDTEHSAKTVEPTSYAKVQVESHPVEVEITGDLSKRELKALESRATSVCSNSSRKSFIDASYSEAKTLARSGTSWISSRGSGDSVYRGYFGSNTVSRVTGILNAVANENSSSRTLSCTDTYGACSNGVIAYTLISSTNIYFCSIFFNEVATSSLCSGTTVASRNVRGGTTLHELTHAVGGTDDVTYGCSADQALSDANKLANADNFNCFTTQVYQSSGCR
ncbi:Metalloprotease [Panaeolus papilionaceus]|nr:Metalloprotease [Panaeolus papilionaceus]